MLFESILSCNLVSLFGTSPLLLKLDKFLSVINFDVVLYDTRSSWVIRQSPDIFRSVEYIIKIKRLLYPYRIHITESKHDAINIHLRVSGIFRRWVEAEF